MATDVRVAVPRKRRDLPYVPSFRPVGSVVRRRFSLFVPSFRPFGKAAGRSAQRAAMPRKRGASPLVPSCCHAMHLTCEPPQ